MHGAPNKCSIRKFKPGEVIECTIDSMTNQGSAIARVDGFVFFIAYAAPGDRIKAQVIKCKKSHGFAKVIEILHPSPHRVEPRCPYFGRCGGCDWQHIDYRQQLREKKELIRSALHKIGNLKNLPEFEVIESPKSYNYRNRIQLQLNNGQPGYFAKNTHQLIAIDHCEIAANSINQVLKQTTFNEEAKKVDIRVDLDGRTKISHATKSLPFQQVNSLQNSNLINYVKEIIAHCNVQTVLDLYCGQGNFTFPLAEAHSQIHFIASDSNRAAIDLAQEKTQFYKMTNIHFRNEDSIETLKSNLSEKTLVLIDPPRTGCTEAFINAIQNSSVQQLIYISCEPTTLARDLKTLLAGQKWNLQAIKGFDMFPQTPHVETVVHALRQHD